MWRRRAVCGLTLLGIITLGGCARLTPNVTRDQPPGMDRPEPSVDERLTQAERFLEHGLTDSALASFGLALEENRRIVEAHMGIGNIYRERGDYEKASRRYERVTELEPDNARAHYYLGLMRQMMGDLRQAVNAYLKSLSFKPDSAQANQDLASAYLQMGEANQALPYAKRATELAPEQQAAWANLASAYSLTGRYDQAVSAYREALDLGEPAPPLLLGLADAHLQVGNYGRAINTLQSLIRNNPSADAYERLGFAQFKQREFERALQSFRRALEYDANHTAALNGLGVALMTLYIENGRENPQRRREALEAWRKSLRLRGDQPRIKDLLSRYAQG